MTGLLKKRVEFWLLANLIIRTMEENDHSIQATLLLHEWWIPAQNTLLQIHSVYSIYNTILMPGPMR